jgi:hypothetical protein
MLQKYTRISPLSSGLKSKPSKKPADVGNKMCLMQNQSMTSIMVLHTMLGLQCY